ncbi:MAG: choice-of-anchor V domain-containing protein [Bryobacteraceae bacterium]
MAVISAVPLVIFGFAEGPPTRKTGAPGDSTCLDCHIGPRTDNSPKLSVTFPRGLTYTPGVKQKLTVVVDVPGVEAWGFEMTARLASDTTNGQAGTFDPADANTQVKCDGGSVRPSGGCPSSGPVEFIEHTLQGTQSNTFTFNWTPPATDIGNVEIYVAANASNGPPPAGANIHLQHYTLTPATVTTNAPAINADNGVVSSASFQPGVATGAWGSIQGSNLSATTRVWQTSDFVNGTGLPTSLDNVSVTVNGKTAYVEFISPTQINFLAPADDHVGPVTVQVTSGGKTSNPVTAQLQSVAPAFFLWNGKYAAASHTDFTFAASPSVFSSAKPSEPGETIILWATGCGQTNPAAAIGQLTSGAPALVKLPKVTIGGVQAEVFGGALSPGFAGLYQIAVEVPKSLTDGDQAVVAEVNGVQSAANVFLTVQHR